MEHLPLGLEGNQVILRFGGGLHSRASIDEIDARECAAGRNFDIDVVSSLFRRRPAIDLQGTAPNGEEIRGFAQNVTQDGVTTTLVQAGGAIYSWDGTPTGFTSVGSVNAAARLRGGLDQNFPLLGKVLITDLALSEPLKEWDGTTFQDLTTNLGTEFRAKYCFVENERAIFANVSTTTATPHLLVGSKRGDPSTLTVTDRPSSALNDEDPFFLPISDFRPINGLVNAFNQIYVTTTGGRIYKTLGATAKDFSLEKFESSSAPAGDEAIVFAGNDIILGNVGRVDSVFGVESFGDARTDDFSRQLDGISEIDDWQIVYNPRVQKIYCFARNRSQLFVIFKPFLDEIARRRVLDAPFAQLSPWSLYSSDLSFGLNTQAAMVMHDPITGLLSTYVGGPNGEIYKMEGTGGQDGGTVDITADRLSRLITLPGREVSNVHGWVKHRNLFPATLTLTFEYQGEALFDHSITIPLGAETAAVWGGGSYWGGGAYYNTPFLGRLKRNHYDIPGQGTDFQVRASVTGSAPFEIQEVGIQFQSAG